MKRRIEKLTQTVRSVRKPTGAEYHIILIYEDLGY